MRDMCPDKDLAKNKSRWLLWGLPTGLFVVGGFLPELRPLLWIPALLVGGVACVANAAGCHRLHCYITGPLYLLAALATALSSLGLVAISAQAIAVAVVGGTVLAYMPEWFRGQYLSPRG